MKRPSAAKRARIFSSALFMGSAWLPQIPAGVTELDYRILKAQQRCAWCAQRRLPNGNDPCLGTLPGVAFACCGHGVAPGYVAFSDDGGVMRGQFDDMPPQGWGRGE